MATVSGPLLIDPSEDYVKHEDLMIYVEFQARRRNKSLLVGSNERGDFVTIARASQSGGTVNLMPTGPNNMFTTEWTDYNLGNPELFGIKNVSIQVKSNAITMVDVVFEDIKGLALLHTFNSNSPTNEPTSNNNPLLVLFDLPYADFRIKFKGHYGQSTSIKLTVTRPANIKFNSSTGNYEISMSFTSKTFGILRDIKLQHLLAARFMLPYLGGDSENVPGVSLNFANSELTSLRELVEFNRTVTKLIEDLDRNDPEVLKYREIDNKIQLIDQAIKQLIAIGKLAEREKYLVRFNEDNFEIATGEKNTSSEINQLYINSIKDYIKVLKDNKINVQNKIEVVLAENIVNPVNKTNLSGLRFLNAGNRHIQELTDIANKFESERNKIGESLDKKLEQTIISRLGFQPTIKEIVRILCNDVDIFLSILRRISIEAERYHTSNPTDIPATNPDEERVRLFAFPNYFEKISIVDKVGNGTESLDKTVIQYPGKIKSFKENWPECQMVEAYLNALLETNSNLGVINSVYLNENNNKDKFLFNFPSDTPNKILNLVQIDESLKFLVEKFYFLYSRVYNLYNIIPEPLLINYLAKSEAFNFSRQLSNLTTKQALSSLSVESDNVVETIKTSNQFPQTTALLNQTSVVNLSNFEGSPKRNGLTVDNSFNSVNLFFPPSKLSFETESYNQEWLKIKDTINSKNVWIKSGFLLGKDLGEDKISVSQDGKIVVRDLTFDSNFTEYKSDYLFNDDFRLTNNEREILVQEQDPDLFTKKVCALFFQDLSNSEILNLPSEKELPLGCLTLLNLVSKPISSTDRNLIEGFIQTYLISSADSIKEIISSNENFTNEVLNSTGKKLLFSIIGRQFILATDSSLTFNEPTTGTNLADFKVNDNLLNTFLNRFSQNLKTLLENSTAQETPRLRVPSSPVTNDDKKLDIYQNFKEIVDRWFSGDEELFDGRPLIDYFRFIDSAGNDISQKLFVDFTSVTNLIDSSNVNINLYTILANLFEKNHILFFPYENFISFEGEGEQRWTREKIFAPTLSSLENGSPQFTCVYTGGNSAKLNISNNGVNQNDGVSLKEQSSIPVEFQKTNAKCFVVKVGNQEQSHFNNVNFSTEQFTVSRESLQIVDSISKKTNSAYGQLGGQSMLSVYNQQSYSVEVGGMGNAMIQPLQFFQLEGVPIFEGLYKIIEVKHNISLPNNMTTTFKGFRIPRYSQPIVQNYFNTIRKAYKVNRRNNLEIQFQALQPRPRVSDSNLSRFDYTACEQAGGVSPQTIVSTIIATPNKINAFMKAIGREEGFFDSGPATNNIPKRLNNPGSIRKNIFNVRIPGQIVGNSETFSGTEQNNFAFFNNPGTIETSKSGNLYENSGWGALRWLIENGRPTSSLNNNNLFYREMSVEQFINIYCPQGDGNNNPVNYVANIISNINKELGVNCTPTLLNEPRNNATFNNLSLNPGRNLSFEGKYSINAFIQSL